MKSENNDIYAQEKNKAKKRERSVEGVNILDGVGRVVLPEKVTCEIRQRK